MQQSLKSDLLDDSAHLQRVTQQRAVLGSFLALDSQMLTPGSSSQPNLVLPWFLIHSLEFVQAVSLLSHHR